MSTLSDSEKTKTEVFVLFDRAKELYGEKNKNCTLVDNLEEILKFEKKNSVELLPELKEWLSVFNLSQSSRIFNRTPILCGFQEMQESFNLGRDLYYQYGWIQKNWMSIASDGCENLYILGKIKPDITETPVFFVDMISTAPESDYVVASNLWYFLKFVFMQSIYEFSSPEEMFF